MAASCQNFRIKYSGRTLQLVVTIGPLHTVNESLEVGDPHMLLRTETIQVLLETHEKQNLIIKLWLMGDFTKVVLFQ